MEVDRVGVHHPAGRRFSFQAQPAERSGGAATCRHLEKIEEGLGIAGGARRKIGARQQAIE